jgi:hypothetical protein
VNNNASLEALSAPGGLLLGCLLFLSASAGLHGSPVADIATDRCGAVDSASGSGARSAAVVARFTLSGAGYDTTIAYTDENNLVFCRRVSETMLWIRLARDTSDRGEEGPHIDIDVCNSRGSGEFTPMNARGNPCPGGMTWGVWWHDGPDVVLANRAESTPCKLVLEVQGDMMEGTFACRGLVTEDGESTLDIVDGWFSCRLVSANAGTDSWPEPVRAQDAPAVSGGPPGV